MSINLPTHYVQQFSTNVQLLLQQRGSVLRDTVTVGSYVGKQASPVDQIGKVAAQRVTTRFEPMPRVDAPTDRRWVFPVDYDLPQLVDTLDKLRMISNPESALVQNAVMAMGRAMDDEIIGAFFGTAKTGELGATSTTFPTSTSTNVVSVNTGGTASNMNVAKLRAARKLLRKNFVDLDNDMIFCAITNVEEDSLLNEIQVVSQDYNSRPVLVDGKLKSFLGFNFVPCERLTTGTDDAAGTSTQVPVWAKSGMHLGIWNDINVAVSQREDLRNRPYQAYVAGSFGATRIEEGKTIKIWCR